MTEFIKLPSGRWINPACIAHAKLGPHNGNGVWVWFINIPDPPHEYYDDDAIVLAAALDAMSIKEGM